MRMTILKLTTSVLLATDSNNDNVYEHIPDPPLEFQEGDILGVYQRGGGRRMRVYYQETTGPENYRRPGSLNIKPTSTRCTDWSYSSSITV